MEASVVGSREIEITKAIAEAKKMLATGEI
jgi:hypothetical protein